MKWKYEHFYRAAFGLIVALLLWSVWTGEAQTNSAAGAATGTNSVSTNAVAAAPAVRTSFFGKLEQEARQQIGEDGEVTPDWVNNLATDFPILKKRYLGNELWKYLASLIYIFLAFYISKLLDFLTRVWLRRWAERAKIKIDNLILELLNGPVKIVAFVVFLQIGLAVLRWPPKVELFLSKGSTIVVALALTYMTLKFVDLFVGYWHRRATAGSDRAFNEQLFPILRKSFKVFVVIVAVLVTAQNLQIDVTAALASLSIGGLAIGLAAQDTLANLFGAVAVFVDRPFQIGDRIQLDNVDGTVESIGLRSTRVRSLKGYLVTIPNKAVGNATITNISRQPSISTEINLGIPVDTESAKLQQALGILREIYGANAKAKGLTVVFDKFKESALNLQVTFSWDGLNNSEYLAGIEAMNLQVKQRFEAAGIPFALPTRVIRVEKDGHENGELVNGNAKTGSDTLRNS